MKDARKLNGLFNSQLTCTCIAQYRDQDHTTNAEQCDHA